MKTEIQQSRIGFLTVIVGPTGTGKTSIAKEITQGCERLCVFDIQEEYELKGLEQFKRGETPFRFSIHPANYDTIDLIKIIELSKGYTFVIEESTGYIDNDFFRSKDGKRLIKLILSKRHIQKESGGGNNFVLMFHSISSIPVKLWPYIDYMFIFKSSEKNINLTEEIILKANSDIKDDEKIKFNDFEIADYRLVVRGHHAKKNIWYVEKFKHKIIT